MDVVQAAVLGLVQGLTEFLPVSSSAHLALTPRLFGWPDQGLAYDVALHWGTLAALLLQYHREWLALLSDGLRRRESFEGRLFWWILLATVPGGLAGLLLNDYAETAFRQPERIALTLMSFGLLLWLADRWGRKASGVEELGWRECLAVGLAQALAVFPGVSRSGITLTAGLALGLRRADAARFSFLLSVPIVAAAGLYKLKDLGPEVWALPVWVGLAVSAASGFAAIRVLLAYLRSHGVGLFAAYRVGLGLSILLLARR